MKGHITLALVGALLLSACQPEPEQFSVVGIKIGDTRASVLSIAPNLACGVGESAGIEKCVGNGPSFEGGTTAYLSINLDEGKVEYVGLVVDAANADKALAAMKLKYGQVGKGKTDARFTDKGLTEWTRWGEGDSKGKQILQIDQPTGNFYTVILRGPMYMVMHELMPRLDLPTPDIKGLKLGDTFEDVKGRFPDAECVKREDGERCLVAPTTFGGSRKALLSIDLHDASVKKIVVQDLDPDDFLYLKKALVEKFGPADDDEQRKARPDLTSADIVWSMPYNNLIMARNPGGGVAPVVMLADMQYYDNLTRKKVTTSGEAL